MLDSINIKYFKLAVGKLKKDTLNEISCDCPECGDTKQRLHLYNTEVGDLVHCFNESCTLADKHHSMLNFLRIINSSFYESYRRETMQSRIKSIQANNSLNNILKTIEKPKVAPKEPSKELVSLPLDNLFSRCTTSKECVEYCTKRGIQPKEDWFFSTQDYFKFQGKNVYLKNFLLIPIYDTTRKYRGFYSRSINKKQFSTFLLDDTEKLWLNVPEEQPTIICEGIFDALVTGFKNCGAMIGASLSESATKKLPKSTIFAFDNDSTGTRKSIQYADKGFQVFVWDDKMNGIKDFNELHLKGYSFSEINEMIKSNLYSGIQAKIHLKLKET